MMQDNAKGYCWLIRLVSYKTIILLTLFVFTTCNARAQDLSAFARPTKVQEVVPGQWPDIVADRSGKLFVCFEASTKEAGSQDILVVTSNDFGVSWNGPTTAVGSTTLCSRPRIGIESNGAIDIVWSDERSGRNTADIFFVRSSDGGRTFSEPVDISNTPGMSTEPDLAVGPDDLIHVVWTDTSKGEKNKDIYYTSSNDGGKTWAKDPLLPAEDISNTPGSSRQPAIVVDSDSVVHVVWLDGTPGETHPDIFYECKKGGSWSKWINVSHSPRISDHPTVDCGPKGKVYVGWLDYSQKPSAPDIWLAVSTNGGKFKKPINISNTPGVSGEPVAAADAKGRLAVVWTDTSKTFKETDIFARISNDCASDFTDVMDISNTPAVSKHPAVVIADDKMIAIWEEVDANKYLLKLTSLSLEKLATGPAAEVNPTIHPTGSNSR